MSRDQLIEECAKELWAEAGCPGTFSEGTENGQRKFRALSRAVFSRLESLGYVVVPREPTREMYQAGREARDAYTNCGCSASEIYRAMIGAAK